MRNIQDIPIQKLFAVVVALKILSSALGWYFNSPWILGFALPLMLMAGYVVVGYKKTPYDISEEKFADSCYYIGFIFTISSIVFALFDLPKLQDNMGPIAIRFGAAMVSTMIGLCIRVYLVNFRKDAVDATGEVENQLIDTANRFRMQLEIATEKLRGLESAVFDATRTSVQKVNVAIETSMGKLSTEFLELYRGAAQQNLHALQSLSGSSDALLGQLGDAVTTAVRDMSSATKTFESSMINTLQALELKGRQTVFPIDLISGLLEEPMLRLAVAVDETAKRLDDSSSELKERYTKVSTALRTMEKGGERFGESVNLLNQSLSTTENYWSMQADKLSGQQQLLNSLEKLVEALGGCAQQLGAQVSQLEGVGQQTLKRLDSAAEEVGLNNGAHLAEIKGMVVEFSRAGEAMREAVRAITAIEARMSAPTASNEQIDQQVQPIVVTQTAARA